jgi:hypothetical protein
VIGKTSVLNPYSYQVSLTIFHPTVDSETITENLKLRPKTTHRVGDRRQTPAGSSLGGVYDRSYWMHRFAVPDDGAFPRFLRKVAQSLLLHRSFFRHVQETGGDIELFVGWWSDGKNIGETITHDLMRVLGELRINIGLDVYPYAQC